MPARPSSSNGVAAPSMPPMPGHVATDRGDSLDGMVRAGQAVHEDAAADQEHGGGADHRQAFHHDGCAARMPRPERLNKPAGLAG